jgi:flavodoxin
MHKTLVTYFTRTGNTKKVAESIFAALEGDKVLKPLDEVQGLDEYALVFIGFPIHSHSVPYKVEVFLKKIPAGKKIALFCTHGSLPGHRLSREGLEHAIVLASKAKILGTFSCRGKVSFEALEVLSKSPEHLEWAEMAASAGSHPNETDLAEAKVFARQVKTSSLHGHY